LFLLVVRPASINVHRVTRDRRLITFLLSPLPLGGSVSSSMKSWATSDEATWLQGQAPQWYEARRLKKVAGWLTTTTNTFIDTFPARAADGIVTMYPVGTFFRLCVAQLY
jgi:hypothetical protein